MKKSTLFAATSAVLLSFLSVASYAEQCAYTTTPVHHYVCRINPSYDPSNTDSTAVNSHQFFWVHAYNGQVSSDSLVGTPAENMGLAKPTINSNCNDTSTPVLTLYSYSSSATTSDNYKIEASSLAGATFFAAQTPPFLHGMPVCFLKKTTDSDWVAVDSTTFS
jgi:hypothetical protein